MLQLIAHQLRHESPGQPSADLVSNTALGKRAPGLARSTDRRRRDCKALLSAVVRLCSCSPAKEAEYFTTQRYSWPWTSIRSAAARTPGCALLNAVSASVLRSRNSTGACFQG